MYKTFIYLDVLNRIQYTFPRRRRWFPFGNVASEVFPRNVFARSSQGSCLLRLAAPLSSTRDRSWNMKAINKYIVLNYRRICFLFGARGVRRRNRPILLLCILMLVSRLALFAIAGAIYGSLKIEFQDLRPLSSKLLPILLIPGISGESRFIKNGLYRFRIEWY